MLIKIKIWWASNKYFNWASNKYFNWVGVSEGYRKNGRK